MGRGVGGRRALSLGQLTAAQRTFNRKNAWAVFKPKDEAVREIMSTYGVPELIARLAAAKGPGGEDMDLGYLLEPALERMVELRTVTDSAGFEPARAIARLRQAIERNERVGVHGDYDCDGIMSSLQVYKALRHYMARDQVEVFLPGRDSGYGFRSENIDRLADRGCSVVVATDCGTRDVATVARARERGVDVVVIDHHEVPEDEPWAEDAIVVNPRILGRDPAPQFHSLCASGLAWKVARELHLEMLGELPVGFGNTLAFAAIGTIADMVPLTYENRILVYQGLRAMSDIEGNEPLSRFRRWNAAGYSREHGFRQPTALDIGLRIAPLVNIGKRLAHETVDAHYVWDVLTDELTRSEQNARTAAIKGLYEYKRELAAKFVAIAEPIARTQGTFGRYVLIEDMPEGLCGQVANNIQAKVGKPTIVLTAARERDAGLLFGSGRAPYPVDLLAHVGTVADLIPAKFGGHPQAVGGIKVRPDDFPAFCTRLEASMQEWIGSIPELKVEPPAIQAAVPLSDWTPELARAVEHEVAPYGVGNPEPVFASYGVRVQRKIRDNTQDGRPKVAVEYIFEQNGATIRATSYQSNKPDPDFGVSAEEIRDVPEGAVANIMYHIGLDNAGAPLIRLKAAKVVEPPAVAAPGTPAVPVPVAANA